MNKAKAIDSFLSRGFHLFPLYPNSKRPATKHGLKDATSCSKQINKWFSGNAKNIAIRTGKCSGIFVIDIDIKNGKDGLDSLMNKYGDNFVIPTESLVFKTPSGGYHIPVQWDDEYPVLNKTNIKGLPGVDIRGENGYIVAAPSTLRVKGKLSQYQVANINAPIAKIDGWIKDLIKPAIVNRKDHSPSSFNLEAIMKGLTEGQRNDQLFRYGCHLYACGLSPELVTGFVKEAANRCAPPFPPSEAEQVIVNAYKYRKNSSNKSKLTTKTLKDIV